MIDLEAVLPRKTLKVKTTKEWGSAPESPGNGPKLKGERLRKLLASCPPKTYRRIEGDIPNPSGEL